MASKDTTAHQRTRRQSTSGSFTHRDQRTADLFKECIGHSPRGYSDSARAGEGRPTKRLTAGLAELNCLLRSTFSQQCPRHKWRQVASRCGAVDACVPDMVVGEPQDPDPSVASPFEDPTVSLALSTSRSRAFLFFLTWFSHPRTPPRSNPSRASPSTTAATIIVFLDGFFRSFSAG